MGWGLTATRGRGEDLRLQAGPWGSRKRHTGPHPGSELADRQDTRIPELRQAVASPGEQMQPGHGWEPQASACGTRPPQCSSCSIRLSGPRPTLGPSLTLRLPRTGSSLEPRGLLLLQSTYHSSCPALYSLQTSFAPDLSTASQGPGGRENYLNSTRKRGQER